MAIVDGSKANNPRSTVYGHYSPMYPSFRAKQVRGNARAKNPVVVMRCVPHACSQLTCMETLTRSFPDISGQAFPQKPTALPPLRINVYYFLRSTLSLRAAKPPQKRPIRNPERSMRDGMWERRISSSQLQHARCIRESARKDRGDPFPTYRDMRSRKSPPHFRHSG